MVNNLASVRHAYLQLQQLEAISFAEHWMYQLSHSTCILLLQSQAFVRKHHVFLLVAQQYRPHPKVHQDGQDTRLPGYWKCTWNLLQQPLDIPQVPTYSIYSKYFILKHIWASYHNKTTYIDGNSPVMHYSLWMELGWKCIERFFPEKLPKKEYQIYKRMYTLRTFDKYTEALLIDMRRRW